jgi:hypothetical protein
MDLLLLIMGVIIGFAYHGYNQIISRLDCIEDNIDVLLEEEEEIEPVPGHTTIDLTQLLTQEDFIFKSVVEGMGDVFFTNVAQFIVDHKLSADYIERFNELNMFEYSKAIMDKLK